MDKIIIVPLLVSAFLCLQRDPRRLFVNLYIPVLLLVPIYYETEFAPSTPEFNFASAILFPVFLSWIVLHGGRGYRYSSFDIPVFLLMFVVFAAQWSNSDYKVAQKALFNDVMTRLAPYLMARAVFSDAELRQRLLLNLAWIGAVIAVVSLLEFKFWINVFDAPLRSLWPEWVPWDGSMKRGGFKRIAGPFAHPICAGYFFALIFPLTAWLWKEGAFRTRRQGFVVLLCVGLGVLISISRAPILGLVLSLIILVYGWAQNRSLVVGALAAPALAGLLFAVPMAIDYVEVDRQAASSEGQRNAAYRRELLDNYLDVAAQRPLNGWGRFTVPWAEGQQSIDNEYLYLALVSGIPALAIYGFIILSSAWSAWRWTRESASPAVRRLGWAVCAALLSAALTQATVYAGTQTVQMFFMLSALAAAPAVAVGREYVDSKKKEFNYANSFSRTM